MMKRICSAVVLFSLLGMHTHAQEGLGLRLQKAAEALQADEQMANGLVGFYAVDMATGEPVAQLNARIGLAPASSQKIVTAATVLELLGPQFRYRTIATADPGAKTLWIEPSGDPSLGSWRYPQNRPAEILSRLASVARSAGFGADFRLQLRPNRFTGQPIPGGWTWDDMGNYYGAGAFPLNWRENQFDIFLRTQNEGTPATLVRTEPDVDAGLSLSVKSGPKESGDHSIVFLPPGADSGEVEGYVSSNEKAFKISASLPRPLQQLEKELWQRTLQTNPVTVPVSSDTLYSPVMDSLVYWFLHKSINLYGEAFAKTLALQNGKPGSTSDGIDLIRQFWTARGIATNELKMIDGSGLSPQNRVSARALVQVLRYASQQTWYSVFSRALPVYNEMKMKSGTIGGAKAFAGIHSSGGRSFAFAIICNGYNGSTNALVRKMYKVLDELK